MESEQPALVRTASRTSSASLSKEKVADPETQIAKDAASDAYLSAQDPEDAPSMLDRLYARFRVPVLLALGLAIPLAAVLIVSTMIVAARTAHAGNGPWITANGWELVFTYGLVALAS